MVSSRPHNFFDTASYAKPLRFQINLATFLNSIQKQFEKICPLGNSTGTFWGQNSKMAKLAKTAVIAGPRAGIFEISKFLSKKLRLLPKNHPRVAWLPDLAVSSFVGNFWSNGNAPRSGPRRARALCRRKWPVLGVDIFNRTLMLSYIYGARCRLCT